ncbi:MAG: hypothetical protein GTO54_06115 [Nitrososphaeria archaeon]|nr:hypothetical protein [Nitrososphaeria archaeon]
MTESYPLPSGRDSIADAAEWQSFVDELKRQWRLMWRERINDKVRAEGIADKDFELLFVDRGTVIVATRSYKPVEFNEILEEYEAPYDVKAKQEEPHPSVGGWRKFGREMAAARRKARKRRRNTWGTGEAGKGQKKGSLQVKKGGRGWLHFTSRK